MKGKQARRNGGEVLVWVKKEGPFDPERTKVLQGSQRFNGRNQPRRGSMFQIDGLNRTLRVDEHRSVGKLVSGIVVVASDSEFDRLSDRGWQEMVLPPPSTMPRRFGSNDRDDRRYY